MDGLRSRLPPSFTNGDAAGGAARSLSSEQHDRIKKAFNALDTDADGRIEILELRAAFDILGVEHTQGDCWDMLAMLEKIRGDSGRPIACVSQGEFSRLAAEKLLSESRQEKPRVGGGGSGSSTKPIASPDETVEKMTVVLEAAHQRAQSITEYYMQTIETEVQYQIEALVLRLQDDNANVLRQLSETLFASSSLGTQAPKQQQEQKPPSGPNLVPTSQQLQVPLELRSPRPPPAALGFADAPLPPQVEPVELQAKEVCLPGGVPDLDCQHGGGSIEPDQRKESKEDPHAPARRSVRSGGARASRKSLSRPSQLAAEAFKRTRGKGTLRVQALAASMDECSDKIKSPNDKLRKQRALDEAQFEEALPPDLLSDMENLKFEKLQEEKDADRNLFVDVNRLKDQVRTALVQNKYNVVDMYKTYGLAQQIARSNAFEIATMLVVIANSVWIWVDADLNHEPVLSRAQTIFQVMEHAFCAYFVFEWNVRFFAFAQTKSAFKDHWFVFDTALVCLTVLETWGLTLLFLFSTGGKTSIGMDPSILKLCRIMRLTRMARMARLLRYMPELLIILRGLWIASKSVFFTLILLLFTIFVFGIMFRQLTDGTAVGERYFYSVHGAMISLLLHGTLPDLAEMVLVLGDQNLGLGILLVLFILIATLTIMNMLVGVLVESVSTVSTIENETLMVNMVRAKMLQMIKVLSLDQDGNGALSKDEFEELLVLPEAAQFIQEVGVDVVGLVEYSDFIFKDKEMSFADFVELILQLRGTNQATVKDIVDLRKQVMQQFEGTEASVLGRLAEIHYQLVKLVKLEQSREARDEMLRKMQEEEETPQQPIGVRLGGVPVGRQPTSLMPLRSASPLPMGSTLGYGHTPSLDDSDPKYAPQLAQEMRSHSGLGSRDRASTTPTVAAWSRIGSTEV